MVDSVVRSLLDVFVEFAWLTCLKWPKFRVWECSSCCLCVCSWWLGVFVVLLCLVCSCCIELCFDLLIVLRAVRV